MQICMQCGTTYLAPRLRCDAKRMRAVTDHGVSVKVEYPCLSEQWCYPPPEPQGDVPPPGPSDDPPQEPADVPDAPADVTALAEAVSDAPPASATPAEPEPPQVTFDRGRRRR